MMKIAMVGLSISLTIFPYVTVRDGVVMNCIPPYLVTVR